MKNYKKLEKKLGYVFKNYSILSVAFCHSSFVNEKKGKNFDSNERLEFLGDAVLELIVTNYLYKNNKGLTEGELSKYRATVVCEDSFSTISRRLGVGEYLCLGKGELLNGGSERNSILADLFEAVVGAIYLDSDFETTTNVVMKIIENDIKKLKNIFDDLDYKTKLQEFIQSKSKVPLKYSLISEKGPSHDKEFEIAVFHNDVQIGTGIGKNKKEAEQNAAKDFLENNKKI